jgi:hypothetical protein
VEEEDAGNKIYSAATVSDIVNGQQLPKEPTKEAAPPVPLIEDPVPSGGIEAPLQEKPPARSGEDLQRPEDELTASSFVDSAADVAAQQEPLAAGQAEETPPAMSPRAGGSGTQEEPAAAAEGVEESSPVGAAAASPPAAAAPGPQA